MTRDEVYLRHILDAIKKIDSYSKVGREDFLRESHWHDASIRQLEIIGEASKRLSSTIRDNHQEVPWRQIAGLRDVLIHRYEAVDVELVWEIIRDRIPALKGRLAIILNESIRRDALHSVRRRASCGQRLWLTTHTVPEQAGLPTKEWVA